MLKTYTVFSIRDEFAKRYFYKSDILFRFLKDAPEADNKAIKKQFDYITNSFTTSDIVSRLSDINEASLRVNDAENELTIEATDYTIYISVFDKYLTFTYDQTYQTEELLYNTLRNICPYIFIINRKREGHYGWVSPLQQNLRYKSGQLLYSFF